MPAAVGGISDIIHIHIPGLANVDFKDVKTVMSEPGKAMCGQPATGAPGHRGTGQNSGVDEIEIPAFLRKQAD